MTIVIIFRKAFGKEGELKSGKDKIKAITACIRFRDERAWWSGGFC
jgi:hypothetical protein